MKKFLLASAGFAALIAAGSASADPVFDVKGVQVVDNNSVEIPGPTEFAPQRADCGDKVGEDIVPVHCTWMGQPGSSSGSEDSGTVNGGSDY